MGRCRGYAEGADDFLFDRASEPFLSGDDLAVPTGAAKSTMADKARAIRQALDLDQLEPRLSRRTTLEHKYAWYVEIDGLMVDARTLPADPQAEARRRGLIPIWPLCPAPDDGGAGRPCEHPDGRVADHWTGAVSPAGSLAQGHG